MTMQLRSKFVPETSERSWRSNWLRKSLGQSGFLLTGFEGYTILNNQVSLLLDRARAIGPERIWHFDDLTNDIRSFLGDPNYQLKLRFADRLGVPYYFVVYSYDDEESNIEQIIVLDVRKQPVDLVSVFSEVRNFAKWLQQFRSLSMTSAYQESGLPVFDQELRRLGSPWPGNLDGLLSCPHKQLPLALVEFQTTIKVGVREHCNNKWFLPKGRRKGDEQRWKVLDIIRLQAGLPLFIFVWSPSEKEVKVKVVERIVYSNDHKGETPGLRYSFKEVMEYPQLQKWLLAQCTRADSETLYL